MLLAYTLFTSRCLVLKINWRSLRNDPRPGCIFVVFMFLTNPNFRPVWYRNFVTRKKWFISLYIITLLWYVCLATITTQFQSAIKTYRFQLWNTPDLRISCMWRFSCYRINSALCPKQGARMAPYGLQAAYRIAPVRALCPETDYSLLSTCILYGCL